MGNILHANAKTTPRIRKEIQESKESFVKLAKKFNINPKTVEKWKKAVTTEDKLSGPIEPKSVLSGLEQETICEFRRLTKFSLDDVFIALRDKIPNMTRSNLYRCLKRKDLNILPKEEIQPKEKKKFKDYGVGFVHIDITEVRTKQGKWFYVCWN